MIVNNRQELKDYLRKILETCGTKAICKICHTEGRNVAFDNSRLVEEPCCAKMNCEWYQAGVDCKENIFLKCLFSFCSQLRFHNTAMTNYLNRLQENTTYPYKLEFPLEIEEFKEKENETN